MKRKKKKDDTYLKNYVDKIKEHKTDLPSWFEIESINIKTDSWFNIKENISITQHKNIINNSKFTNEKIINAQLIKMKLSKFQKDVLDKWFIASTKMYNETLKYVRNNFEFTKNYITSDIIKDAIKNKTKFFNFYYLRDKLIDIKNKIILESQLESTNKNTQIHSHTLDETIHQFCSNVKTAKSNLLNGTIKRFRMKFWKLNRPSQTIHIEEKSISNNRICYTKLGDLNLIYNNKKVHLVDKKDEFYDSQINYNLKETLKLDIRNTIKINYNSILKEYTLIVPNEIDKIVFENKKSNILSLDPGLRTFMSGISENGIVNIGEGVNKIISKSIIRLNKIKNNKDIPKKIKKKNELLINRKISNKINDMHWKTIRYITRNYETVYLGDMSVPKI